MELTKEIAIQQEHKTTIKLTYTNSVLAVWATLHGEQSLTVLNRYGVLQFNKNYNWIDLIFMVTK